MQQQLLTRPETPRDPETERATMSKGPLREGWRRVRLGIETAASATPIWVVTFVAVTSELFGQTNKAGGEPEGVSNDYRGQVMLGFSSVFVLIVGYLILSHKRNSALKEDVEMLKSRVKSLS